MAAGPTFVMETFTYVPLTIAMDVISIISTTGCKRYDMNHMCYYCCKQKLKSKTNASESELGNECLLRTMKLIFFFSEILSLNNNLIYKVLILGVFKEQTHI